MKVVIRLLLFILASLLLSGLYQSLSQPVLKKVEHYETR
jgi:type II secretory pathway component PulM